MINLSVTWNANPTAEQITGYNVYLDGVLKIASPGISTLISDVSPGTHTVAVSAVNALTEGPQSDPVQVNVPALPTKVQNVRVSITFDLGS